MSSIKRSLSSPIEVKDGEVISRLAKKQKKPLDEERVSKPEDVINASADSSKGKTTDGNTSSSSSLRVLLIPVTGAVEEHTVSRTVSKRLKDLQCLIGGRLEGLYPTFAKGAESLALYCDEEGLNKNLRLNQNMADLGIRVSGPVILYQMTSFGNETQLNAKWTPDTWKTAFKIQHLYLQTR